MADSPLVGDLGSMSFGIGVDLAGLRRDLRTFEAEVKTAAKTAEATAGALNFGKAIAGGIVAIKALEGGVAAFRALQAQARGDTEGMVKALSEVPVIGGLIRSVWEAINEETKRNAEYDKNVTEQIEKRNESLKRTLDVQRQIADAVVQSGKETIASRVGADKQALSRKDRAESEAQRIRVASDAEIAKIRADEKAGVIPKYQADRNVRDTSNQADAAVAQIFKNLREQDKNERIKAAIEEADKFHKREMENAAKREKSAQATANRYANEALQKKTEEDKELARKREDVNKRLNDEIFNTEVANLKAAGKEREAAQLAIKKKFGELEADAIKAGVPVAYVQDARRRALGAEVKGYAGELKRPTGAATFGAGLVSPKAVSSVKVQLSPEDKALLATIARNTNTQTAVLN